jgi:excisionase family DNA binding protein
MATTDARKQRFVAAASEFAACLADFIYDLGVSAPVIVQSSPVPESTEKLLSLKQAADLMCVSVSTFKRKVEAGEIRKHKITGKAARYKLEEVERLIRRLK